MPKPLPPDHPTFGPCITVRKKSFADWAIYGILMLLLSTFGVGLILGGISALISGAWTGIVAILIGPLLLFIVIACFRSLAQYFEFYERGAVVRVFSKATEFAYADAVTLTYALTRQYYNGIYTGTSQQLAMKSGDKRSFKFSGTHKEKPKGLLRIIGLTRTFEGEDELDIVRSIIAAEIAGRALKDVLAGTPFNWCKQVELTTDGIRPLRGKRKTTLVPWSEIHGISADKGAYHIFAKGDKRSFANFAMNAPNFHPGLELFSTLLTPHLPQDPSTAESAPAATES